MPNEKALFQTTGAPWSARARLGELDAVLTGTGNHVRNLFLHHTHLVAGDLALSLLPKRGRVLDFGFGTGRFMRHFAPRAAIVVGTEVTREMADRARGLGLPDNCVPVLTDGIRIPIAAASIDLVWVCAVLRYSLNVPNPAYRQIADEMARVLRPGGRVVNVEMYVDQPASNFTEDFEAAGFRTEMTRVLHWHDGRLGRFVQSGRWPSALVPLAARVMATCRSAIPPARRTGLRDYVFVWKKPA